MGFQARGFGITGLYHFGPLASHASRNSSVDAFSSWSPNSVPQDGQILKLRGPSSISYPQTVHCLSFMICTPFGSTSYCPHTCDIRQLAALLVPAGKATSREQV